MASDSIHDDDPQIENQKKQKSRRPANTAFRQQRLKAWQPILTPKTVLPIFFAVGIIFAPIGGLLLWASAGVQEISIDYTNCNASAPVGQFEPIPPGNIFSSFKSSDSVSPPQWSRETRNVTPPYSVSLSAPVCSLQFTIPNDIGPPVFLYYRLTNFYQNHRRYVKSLDTDQLRGQALSNSSIDNSACNPLKLDPDTRKPYYPCGLIANSIFNDTILSPQFNSPDNSTEATPFVMTNQSIAWGTDATLYKKTAYTNDQVSPPPNWKIRYPNGYTDANPIPDLSQYEEFQVWMRTAGLPTFSKLALRNDGDIMRKGTYTIQIYDFFPASVYGGTKTIFLSTRTVVGGKNSFLGIAYVVVGGLCIILGVFFTLAHLIKPRKLGDHTYLSWNNDSQATATTTGRDSRPGAQTA